MYDVLTLSTLEAASRGRPPTMSTPAWGMVRRVAWFAGSCPREPSPITNRRGTATAYGIGYGHHLVSLGPAAGAAVRTAPGTEGQHRGGRTVGARS